LASPLKNPGFHGVFRISAKFLWPSVAPMQLGAWRRAALAFRVALSKLSRFSSRTSRQNTGVLHNPVWHRSTMVEAVGFELSVRSAAAWGWCVSPLQLIDRLKGAGYHCTAGQVRVGRIGINRVRMSAGRFEGLLDASTCPKTTAFYPCPLNMSNAWKYRPPRGLYVYIAHWFPRGFVPPFQG
jgi:hypothetical protein